MRLSLAALLLLGGCTLIDQRSFAPNAPAPGAAEVARAGGPSLPLVSLPLDGPVGDRRALLAEAVQAAEARKPDVSFDVVAAIPSLAPAAEQDRRAAEGARDVRSVATDLMAVGVAPERIRLGLRGDTGAPAREVRIYVR